ncbi:MAG: DUF58 domain-containing protein [Opitutaceae bacterium]|nr:DUF58 domain-containing protein [Opitutaceae bacterium]
MNSPASTAPSSADHEASPGRGAPGRVDAKALMRIRSLELRARIVVEGFLSGLHRSPYHGFSVEFTEYRPYTQGDDPRYLDWKVLARSDRTYIKKFEDETNLRCHLVVDRSRSMDFGTVGYSKSEYAITLAATLAHFLAHQGDAVGLVSFDETVREYLPARSRSGHLRQILIALERPAAGRSTDLVAPLEQLARLVKKRGLLVLVSDFLAPLDRLESSLAMLTAAGHEAAVFQILDPAETSLDFPSSAMFEDMETARTLHADPEGARRAYVERFSAHASALQTVCARLGVSHSRILTSEPLDLALLEFLQRRKRTTRGRRVAGGLA